MTRAVHTDRSLRLYAMSLALRRHPSRFTDIAIVLAEQESIYRALVGRQR